jgi:desulfoferrodoxin (superoxide reductase-like protein)
MQLVLLFNNHIFIKLTKPYMTLPKPQKRNIPYQVALLKTNLELPITNIVFDQTYAFVYLYVNEQMIGTIGFDAGIQIHYHKTEEHKIAWDKVYMQSKDIINTKIREQEELADQITIAPYKTLYVKDKAGKVIKMAHCAFRNDEWVIVLIDVKN